MGFGSVITIQYRLIRFLVRLITVFIASLLRAYPSFSPSHFLGSSNPQLEKSVECLDNRAVNLHPHSEFSGIIERSKSKTPNKGSDRSNTPKQKLVVNPPPIQRHHTFGLPG